MAMTDIYAEPLTLESLQQFKALAALGADSIAVLARIEGLDVADFNEAEVRANIIDPMVRVLGYDKGTDFSVDLERYLKVLEKDLKPDYKFNLWQADFWILEAKKPRFGEANFAYKDLSQALEYAAHPQINAALVVLCDGIKIEVFDREVDLTRPILHVDREHLRRDFGKLRHLLEPWQLWFFQKRRILRSLDKVFDREFNMQRVEEFKALVEARLNSKRQIILENFRRNMKPDTAEVSEMLLRAPIEDLVEVHLFLNHPVPALRAMTTALIKHSEFGSFRTLFRILPDQPRDTNDLFYGQALRYLFELAETRETVEWFPAWLAQGQQSNVKVEFIAQHLLRLCVTHFAADEARKTILLAAAAFRRVIKVLLMSSDVQWRQAQVLHILDRYQTPELAWRQAVASPAGQMLGMLESGTLGATYRFVAACRGERGEFKTESAKLKLKAIWQFEKEILSAIDNYPKLREERALGEMHPTESVSVNYDFLGHFALCVVSSIPKWKEYILQTHQAELRTLAALGSWSARELLGLEKTAPYPPLSDEEVATRFFFGDIAMMRALRSGYAGRAAGAGAVGEPT
ncbi:MAG: type I restriction enzyme HsdR N-terminal domain-containing protein [Metallibacterium scheffleri]|uniref:Uncharacterized protein n=1 Tax=Metallibacterium scheffleri TaxID=993689 RepID=A0A4S3KGL9_9GAMM|nr:type I restriction enzyme HsdR N-terminal domain-containing protein [Metallibacterium scheffleri]THD07104.1 hypothetical protein B1806_15415 [Metallibacterium scheffleri]